MASPWGTQLCGSFAATKSLELVFCVSTQETAMWGSMLIKISRVLLGLKHRGYVPSERCLRGVDRECTQDGLQ
jgi:hypothetical protein